MLEIPIAVFVLLVLNVFIEIIVVLYALCRMSANKKDYEDYIEEEYGQKGSNKKGD